MDSAMDLSLRPASPPSSTHLGDKSPSLTPQSICTAVGIIRPTPRPPWSILWYQNIWSTAPSDQSEPASDKICKNKAIGENYLKTKTILRANERSSFSVLYNISTNCIDDANNNSGNPLTNVSSNRSAEYQIPHHFNSSNDNYNRATSRNDTRPMGVTNSLMDYDQYTSTSASLYEPHRYHVEQESSTFRSAFQKQDESDNSENIILTSQPKNSTDSDSDCTKKPSSSCSIAKMVISQFPSVRHNQQESQTTAILDVACCDGPVQFKRISNPNFALTVEHNEACAPIVSCQDDFNKQTEMTQNDDSHQASHEQRSDFSTLSANAPISLSDTRFQFLEQSSSMPEEAGGSTAPDASTSTTITTHKSYLCIYCNQSFKSLFCYQKHKKRHLNPVSVDITTTTANSTSFRGSVNTSGSKRTNILGGGSTCRRGGGGRGGGGGGVGVIPENAKAKTKDLNVQFFPCKKCGCKFPSYYFVHKHRKICH